MNQAKILIVDDDVMLGEQLRGLLGVMGHKVVYQRDPEKALLLVEEWTFDIVFCDYWLPPDGGKHFYEQLARRRPELAPRLIFLISSVLGDGTQCFIRSTGNLQLVKPFKLPAVQQVLREALTSVVHTA
jgi:CheY-like chemotaxis protein